MPSRPGSGFLQRTMRLGEALRAAQMAAQKVAQAAAETAARKAGQTMARQAAPQAMGPQGASQARFDPARLVEGLLGRLVQGGATAPGEDADFRRGVFTGVAGSRPYRLYVPPGVGPHPGLLVMLHGCTQTAEDFAAGTRMNTLAAAAGLLVLYPVQVASANSQRCWNWFNPADRRTDGGEAALIAGMTRMVMQAHAVNPRRVFVAGLSAGGAQAAALGAAFPELYAAVGVHSGLACGAANDVAGAFAAMRTGHAGAGRHRMRTIVFHGDRDRTVAAANAGWVADQVVETAPGAVETETGQSEGGMAYTRSVRRDAAGRPAIEQWVLHGAGHAWSGGSADGSYTEPRGPNASAAMIAFFGA